LLPITLTFAPVLTLPADNRADGWVPDVTRVVATLGPRL
jgi:hypothetical protein